MLHVCEEKTKRRRNNKTKEDIKKKEAQMMKRRREYVQQLFKCHQSKTASLERGSLSLALGNERKVEKQFD